MNADAFCLSLGAEFFCGVKPVIFAKRVSDLTPQGFNECISHTAADNDIRGAFEQIFDDEYFVGNLGAADDGGEGFLGLVEDFFGAADL